MKTGDKVKGQREGGVPVYGYAYVFGNGKIWMYDSPECSHCLTLFTDGTITPVDRFPWEGDGDMKDARILEITLKMRALDCQVAGIKLENAVRLANGITGAVYGQDCFDDFAKECHLLADEIAKVGKEATNG